MKPVIWTSKDKTLRYKLEFVRKHKLKFTHLGKDWPIHTHCILFEGDFVIAFDTIVKHGRDEDNPAFAYKFVAEKCLIAIKDKWVRSQIRLLLKESLTKLSK